MRRVRGVGVGILAGLLLVALLAGGPADAASKGKGALVVVEHERWLDTLKGTVKNFGKSKARDVTVIVRFQDKRKKPLGVQRVSVGDLNSGDQASFSLAVEERNRPAAHYQFEAHAIWP
jgi:hypothetical protein